MGEEERKRERLRSWREQIEEERDRGEEEKREQQLLQVAE